jgi:hypothetical protein
MTVNTEADTAAIIRNLAKEHHVSYSQTPTDRLAQHMTRLAGDSIELDEIEQLIIALQRAGHLTRIDAVRFTARYRREVEP